jgi:hypothetical protein
MKKTKIDEVLCIVDQRRETIDKCDRDVENLHKKIDGIIKKERIIGENKISLGFGFNARFPIIKNPMIVIFKQGVTGKIPDCNNIHLYIEEGKALYEMLKELYG